MESNGESVSLWMATAQPLRYTPLQGDIECEVCVIGAGIAGLSTAYMLARQGRDVVLLEAMDIGSGESGRTTAHFFPPDEWYAALVHSFGKDSAGLIADGHRQATARVESIVRDEGIACEFERLDGYLVSATADAKEIAAEAAAARAAGVEVEELERVPGLDFDTGPCLRFPAQAQFHPLKYLNGLAQAMERCGGRIFTGTRATDLSKEGPAARVVETEHGKVHARAVVVATNTPFNDRVVMHTKQAGYRTYVIGLQLPKGAAPRILMWDTGDPYYYVRVADAGDGVHDILIVGGADHKVGQDSHPEHRFNEIEAWARARYPAAGALAWRWSGEVMEPADGLAFFGHNPLDGDNVYIITGDSGNGMTHCTLGAMAVSDFIAERPNPWVKLYDPARKPFHGVGTFFREQANTVARYRDWLRGGSVDSVDEIAAGQGAIVGRAGKKLAVYRDPDGGLHALSAACSHLGCVVAWNPVERSWDCPCHASRFDIDGAVLHGPATRPLKQERVETDGESAPVRSAGPGTEQGAEQGRGRPY